MNRESRSMNKKKSLQIIPDERVIKQIFFVRGKKVMFDSDLAEMYGVETKALNQAVKRNKERFPKDFMFQLTLKEATMFLGSRSQIVTLKETDSQMLRSPFATSKRGGNVKYAPYVFTEQGVAMLSSVLKSKRAIQINIHIMRVFTELREMLLTHKDLRDKIEKMEKKYDKQFRMVFDAMKQMMIEKTEPVKKIGFVARKKT